MDVQKSIVIWKKNKPLPFLVDDAGRVTGMPEDGRYFETYLTKRHPLSSLLGLTENEVRVVLGIPVPVEPTAEEEERAERERFAYPWIWCPLKKRDPQDGKAYRLTEADGTETLYVPPTGVLGEPVVPKENDFVEIARLWPKVQTVKTRTTTTKLHRYLEYTTEEHSAWATESDAVKSN
jgi:hypothetical protein